MGRSVGDPQVARPPKPVLVLRRSRRPNNCLAEATRRDADLVALVRLECTKAVSRLRILERGKEVVEARVMALEEE